MFHKLKNIDIAFQHIRTFSLVLLLTNLLCFCFYTYRADKRIEKAEDKVLLLLNGKVISAVVSSRKENLEVEARDHIKTFHELFFSLDPDEKVIKANLTRALYLADANAKNEYDNLQEKGYYANIISANISQSIKIDSITINQEQSPYAFHCYATQSIIRSTSKLTRNLVTSGTLRSVARSDNNSHGFLIEHWTILENKDLKTESR